MLKLEGGGVDSTAVHQTGIETVGGAKTFTSTITLSGSAALVLSGGAIQLATSTNFSPGISTNTGHIAVVGKGLDFASFDSTASPGAANAGTFPMGKAAVASGANSVVITTSACRALSSVFITPIDVDTAAPLFKVTSADGSFTVATYNTSGVATNVGANWKFNWICCGKSQYE